LISWFTDDFSLTSIEMARKRGVTASAMATSLRDSKYEYRIGSPRLSGTISFWPSGSAASPDSSSPAGMNESVTNFSGISQML
jgi:hypothetical protein